MPEWRQRRKASERETSRKESHRSYAGCSTEPPAPSILVFAEALTASTATVNFRSKPPFPRTLTRSQRPLTSPMARSVSSLTVAPSSKRSFNCDTLTTATVGRKATLLKPFLGRRRCRGICPPSNPGRTPPPDRDFCPLCPRPEVLPWPELSPQPRRLRRCLAPGFGFSS